MSLVSAAGGSPSRATTVEHWFDFICPYCYIAQDRNQVLCEHGVDVAGHALKIHPEIGPGGTPAGPRTGPAHALLAREAAAAGLPLRWSDRIPDSRPALAAFAWLDGTGHHVAERFAGSVFAAYFGDGRDIESGDLLVALAEEAGGDAERLRAARTSGAADAALTGSEALAGARGVGSTPTWIADGRSVSGLRPREWYAAWAATLVHERDAGAATR